MRKEKTNVSKISEEISFVIFLFFHFLLKMKWSKIFLFPFLMLAGWNRGAKRWKRSNFCLIRSLVTRQQKGNEVQIFDLIISWWITSSWSLLFPFPFIVFSQENKRKKKSEDVSRDYEVWAWAPLLRERKKPRCSGLWLRANALSSADPKIDSLSTDAHTILLTLWPIIFFFLFHHIGSVLDEREERIMMACQENESRGFFFLIGRAYNKEQKRKARPKEEAKITWSSFFLSSYCSLARERWKEKRWSWSFPGFPSLAAVIFLLAH